MAHAGVDDGDFLDATNDAGRLTFTVRTWCLNLMPFGIDGGLDACLPRLRFCNDATLEHLPGGGAFVLFVRVRAARFSRCSWFVSLRA